MALTTRSAGLALAMIAILLGAAPACSGSSPDAQPPATSVNGADPGPLPDTAAISAATEAWWHYQRPPTFEVVRTDVSVPMRDGTSIGCSLGRPATGGAPATGTFPGLVVEFTPYALITSIWDKEADFFIKRGYNGLVCTIRGTGRSGGTWQNAMSSQDGRDAHDLVEWLAVQPYADGRVGMVGESYGGQTAYGAAVERAPHLKAVAPMQPPGNLYDDVIYPGGIKATEGGTIDNWPTAAAETLSQGRIKAADEYAANRAHPTFDDYWKDRAIAPRVADITVPVLTIGGWDDENFRSGTLSDIEGATERTWAIYGPWKHRPPVDLGAGVNVEGPLPAGVLLAWFDHWVKELPGLPIAAKPTFVSYEGPIGTGRGWREVSAPWPPRGRDVSYRLGADGTLAESAPDGTAVFHQPAEPTAAGGSLVFSTRPLDRDRVLLGHGALTMRAGLSATDANFHIELIDVDPAGKETVVNDGFLKASHRDGHTDPTPVRAGEPVDYRIAVRADHHRFAAGHLIRLRVSGGASTALVPIGAPVDTTVHTGTASTLSLPLVTPEGHGSQPGG